MTVPDSVHALVAKLRLTSNNRLAAAARLFVAVMFAMTGAMKLIVPALGLAWSAQLIAAELPFYALTVRAVPFIEIALGITLALGFFTRFAALVAIGIMLAATYVHLVVADPSLFPLQPNEPVIPLVVLATSMYVLYRGAGSWSADLAANKAPQA